MSMEIQFSYSRDDWAHIDMQNYKDWLYAQRPLSNTEYATCWLLLVFSVLGAIATLAFVVRAVWLGQAWYVMTGVMVLLFMCGIFLEIIHPRREAVRGLIFELIFRLHLEEGLIERVRRQRDRHFRELEAKGQLNLSQRYVVRIDPGGYTRVTEYPKAAGPPTRQEVRRPWSEVTELRGDERVLFIQLGIVGNDPVPRSAFADDEAYQRFAKAAEEYRAGHHASLS
jgi:hypothetical protein